MNVVVDDFTQEDIPLQAPDDDDNVNKDPLKQTAQALEQILRIDNKSLRRIVEIGKVCLDNNKK